MRHLLGLAGIAVLALALTAGDASASRSPVSGGGSPPGGGAPAGGPSTPSTPTGGSGGGTCTVLCIKLPAHPRLSQTNYEVCGERLSQLGRVTARQIEGVVDGHKVHVVPLCDTTTNHSLTQPEQAYLSRGNVQGLLPVIAANPILVGKLAQGGYKTNDVLGVNYASNATLLYVTHR